MFHARPVLTRLSLLGFAAVASFGAGACFNGDQARGLPCESDAQCGTAEQCIDGYCGGVFLCADDSVIDAVAVCDGVIDCADGADEDLDLCVGEFVCDDGTTSISNELVCNGENDCDDEADEGEVCAGVGVNACSGSDGDIRFEIGPGADGVPEPLEVLALDIMGSPTSDFIVASRGGNTVKIVFELEADLPREHDLGGMVPSFDGRPVVAYKTGEVNGDNRGDIVVFAGSDELGGAIYVYQNNRPEPPSLFGDVIDLTAVPGLEVVPDIQGVELGRLNNDSSVDVVAVVDLGALKGRVLTSDGDSSEAAGGGAYFNPQVLDVTTSIPYEQFTGMAVADVDGNTLDDLLVTGFDAGGAKLWLLLRGAEGDLTDWTLEPAISLAFPGPISLGRYANSPGIDQDLGGRPDVAILDPMNGRVQALINSMGPQLYMTGPVVELIGEDITGLALGDLNCDEQADFAYNAGSLGEVHVLFGAGDGDVLSPYPVRVSVDGVPMGTPAFDEFDADETPDIFSAVSAGNGGEPRVQVLVSNQLVQ